MANMSLFSSYFLHYITEKNLSYCELKSEKGGLSRQNIFTEIGSYTNASTFDPKTTISQPMVDA
jgi:hypothetical protein